MWGLGVNRAGLGAWFPWLLDCLGLAEWTFCADGGAGGGASSSSYHKIYQNNLNMCDPPSSTLCQTHGTQVMQLPCVKVLVEFIKFLTMSLDLIFLIIMKNFVAIRLVILEKIMSDVAILLVFFSDISELKLSITRVATGSGMCS